MKPPIIRSDPMTVPVRATPSVSTTLADALTTTKEK